MRGLYAIVDVACLATLDIDPIAFTRAVLEARPAAIQVRAKDVPAREVLSLLRAVGPLCRSARASLVANDRPDLATLAGCEYVHLGQDDVPSELVHRLAPGLKIGLSTHSLAELDRAISLRPDYVAFGPVFETKSKANPDPVVGIEGLRQASLMARAARIPLVAIGGINGARAQDVARFADCAAVIADLIPASGSLSEVSERAHAIANAFVTPAVEAIA